MLPPTKQMVLNVEYNVSPVSVLTASGYEVVLVGFINYTDIVTDDVKFARELCYIYLSCSHFLWNTGYFLNHPGVRNLAQQIESVLGLFVVEAKDRGLQLDDHVPQVLTQLYATATKLKCGFHLLFHILQSQWLGRKTHIRGALTNGYEWLFLILNINSNGKGGSYRISDRSYSAAPQEAGINMVIPDMPPDMIAGILASWVCHQLLWMCCVFIFY